MKKGYSKRETKSTIVAALEQALGTLCKRNMRNMVYGKRFNTLSCMWCCSWNSYTYCFRMLKTRAEGVQTSQHRNGTYTEKVLESEEFS